MSPEYRRVVATPALWEQPPPTVQPSVSESRWQRIVVGVLRPLWACRTEIAAGVVGVAMWGRVASAIGWARAGVVVIAFTLGVSRIPAVRRVVVGVFHRSRLRRRWMYGVRYAGLATLNDRVPRPVRIASVRSGDLMRVRVPAGSNTAALADKADTIAAYLQVRDVRVVRDPSNARMASVRVVTCDPLHGRRSIAWGNVDALRLSVWDAIPVGSDEDGNVVSIMLVEHNVAVGGEPGAGKSVVVSMLVATAALDPSVVLWLFDGKMVELAVWKGCAHRWVGPDVEEAIEVLRELVAVCDKRLVALVERGKRKVEPGDGLPLHVVVVDELAYYCRKPRPHGPEFSNLLQDLVSRGRAAGIIVVAATQKPSHDVIPTALRDLFGFRWALRCSTREASDTVLGSGWSTRGFSAAGIDAADRGVGYLLHEGGTPVRLKACYLSDEDLKSLAARGEALRSGGSRVLEAVSGE